MMVANQPKKRYIKSASRIFSKLFQFVLLIIFLSLQAGTLVSAKDLEEQKWIEVKTANFKLFSNQKEKKTVELARNLEMFRLAVSAITNVQSTESPIPTIIFVFQDRKGFLEVGGDWDTAGIFLSGMRKNTIVMRETSMSEASVILHEYVHFLLHNHGSLNYPKWFDEGFSEYLSGIKNKKGKFEIGNPNKNRNQWLAFKKWVSIEDILAPENMDKWRDEKLSMFYAQSWLLVHYLVNRPGKRDAFTQEMTIYLGLLESGSDSVPSFEEAFGISTKELSSEVKRYYKKNQYRIFVFDSNQLSAGIDPEVTTLEKQIIALHLANLAFGLGEWGKAEELYEVALTNPGTRPRAEAGIGDLYKFRGDLDVAQPYFERAVALAPEDPYCQLDLAEYWHARAASTTDESERAESLINARRGYTVAWKLDKTMPETYAMIGQTYSMEGNDYPKAIEMLEEAQYLLPSDLSIRLMLAEAYAGAERTDEALKAARSILAWGHKDSEASKRAQEVIMALEVENEGPAESNH